MKNAISQAVISSKTGDIVNAKCHLKGRTGACCLSNVYNVAKDTDPRVFAKPTKIVMESFFKRPSLNDQAMEGIMNVLKDGMLVEQSYHYRTEAEVGVIFFMGDHFRTAQTGDVVVLHFVDGMLLNPEVLQESGNPRVGSDDYEGAKVSEAEEFGHGENTFLVCSREFAAAISEQVLEDELARASYTIDEKRNITSYDCNRWLKALREIYEETHLGKEYTAIAFSIPTKRQRPGKGILIIAIIVIAVILLIFFALGALRRGKGGPPGGGPGRERPGNSQQEPFDPNGGT